MSLHYRTSTLLFQLLVREVFCLRLNRVLRDDNSTDLYMKTSGLATGDDRSWHSSRHFDEKDGYVHQTILVDKGNDDTLNECQDPAFQSEMGTTVRLVREFFQQQNATIYPTVLTAVAAMRYGSVAVKVANKPTLVDHDLDFMLAFSKPKTVVQMKDDLVHFQFFFKNRTGLDTAITNFSKDSSPDDETKWARGWLDADNVGLSVLKHYRVMFLEIYKHTKLTEKLNEDGLFSENRILQKRYFQFVGGNSSNMPDSQQIRFGKGAVMRYFTMLNFWTAVQQTSRYEASPVKKMFFMGEVFDFPQDDRVLFDVLMDEFGVFHRASASTSLCDFSYPQGLFEEDMEQSDETFKLARMCTTQLQNKGFVSFAHCDAFKLSNDRHSWS